MTERSFLTTPRRVVAGQQFPSSRVFPAAILLDSSANAWSIGDGGWVLRNGVRTNGRASAIDNSTGKIMAKAPSNGHWYEWRGNNLWTDRGAADPATTTPIVRQMTISSVVPIPSDLITVRATP